MISSDILGRINWKLYTLLLLHYFVIKIWPPTIHRYFFNIQKLWLFFLGRRQDVSVYFTIQKYDVVFCFLIVDKQNICDIKQLIRTGRVLNGTRDPFQINGFKMFSQGLGIIVAVGGYSVNII